MNKEEYKKKYAEVKAQKAKASSVNKTLFNSPVKKGCSTCGKSTWKPNKKHG